jgi:hypothetical protein
MKSGLVLFHEAIEEFRRYEDMKEHLQRFERAAAKGHEEAIWIVSVLKDVEMDWDAWKAAFAKTKEPLGWYFAGILSEWDSRERFDFFKKSAEGGCSWGQVEYGEYFRDGLHFVEKDEKVYLDWMEKAANQHNPSALGWLGYWFLWDGGDEEKAVSYYRTAAELGWENSMEWLAVMLREGEGCEKDLRQAAMWNAKVGSFWFWNALGDARRAFESGTTENLDVNFNQLCYSLGGGLYWYMYETWKWNEVIDSDCDSDRISESKNDKNDSDSDSDSEMWNEEINSDRDSDSSSELSREEDVKDPRFKAFGNRCLDYYCSCVELQQKSILTFLWFWNRTTGVKGPGQMIAQMVWEQREDNLVKTMKGSSEQEPELKRIKK